jgi:hypothetical protein
MIKSFYRGQKGFRLHGSGYSVRADIAHGEVSESLSSVCNSCAVQYADRSFAYYPGQTLDASSPIYRPESADEAARMYGGNLSDVNYDPQTGNMAAVELLPDGMYRKAEYTFDGVPDNVIPEGYVSVDDAIQIGAAYLRSLSAAPLSSFDMVYTSGPKIELDDANDEFEYTFDRGTTFTMYLTPRTAYVIDQEMPEEKFRIFSRQNLLKIFAASKFEGERLNAMMRNAPVKNLSDYQSLGTSKKAQAALRIPFIAGTTLYKNVKTGEHHLDVNMAESLESLGFAKVAIKELVKAFDGLAPAVSKIRRVVDTVNIEDNAVVEAKRPTQSPVQTVYGAYFAVSVHQPQRSRVVFAATEDEALNAAKGIVSTYKAPVKITSFVTTNRDPLYSTGVVVKNTAMMARYKGGERSVLKPKEEYVPNSSASYIEPRTNPPELTISAISANSAKIAEKLRRMIGGGFFTRMLDCEQGDRGLDIVLRFPRNAVADKNEAVATARRITSWFLSFGVKPEVKVNALKEEGKLVGATLTFMMPKVTKAVQEACDSLRKNPPMIKTALYAVKGKEHLVVEVVSFNIHTGRVLVNPVHFMSTPENLMTGPSKIDKTRMPKAFEVLAQNLVPYKEK